MISLIVGFILFVFVLGIGFRLAGVALTALIWLFFMIPLACIALLIGAICCCTLILIPVGIWFFKMGIRLIVPRYVI